MHPQYITNLPNRICQHCGTTFYSKPSRLAYNRGKYCSPQCFYSHRKALTSVHIPIPNCKCNFCGEPFYRRMSHLIPIKKPYCSMTCWRAACTVEYRFWSQVNKTDGCWTWTGTCNRFGYGILGIKGHMKLTHRLSYEFVYGPIADGLCVCHTCDNPPCVNPAHLFLGTHADNMHDMAVKGRRKKPRIGSLYGIAPPLALCRLRSRIEQIGRASCRERV